jgi:hypothetical protein
MATAFSIIQDSLIELGAADPEEAVTSAMASGCLQKLNDMLDAMATEDLLLYYSKVNTLALISSTISYTVGSGGVLNIARPIEFLWARYYTDSEVRTPLSVISFEDYSKILSKETSPSVPSKIAYQPTYPLGTLYVWPAPTSGQTLELGSNMQFTQVSDEDLTTEIDLPPGYRDYLVMELAHRLCIRFGRKEMMAEIAERSKQAMIRIKRKNPRHNQASFDPALLPRRSGRYNPYTDT